MSADTIRSLYMSSQQVEWGPFCTANGWNPVTLRAHWGSQVTEWVKEKKRVLQQKHAEELAEMTFEQLHNWRKDVSKTLREFPLTTDLIHTIIRAKANEYAQMIARDEEAMKIYRAQKAAGKSPNIPRLEFAKVKTGALQCLAVATKVVVEAKHRSLLLSDLSVKAFSESVDPVDNSAEEGTKTTAENGEWKLRIIGFEDKELSAKSIQGFIDQYLDKPAPRSEEEAEARDASS